MQQSSFLFNTLINQKEIQQKFYKDSSPNSKKILPLNQLKTSQKPSISLAKTACTQQSDSQSCAHITPKSMTYFNEQTCVRRSYEREIVSEDFLQQNLLINPRQKHEICKREISRLKVALMEQKRENEKCHKEIRKHQYEKVQYEEIVFELKRQNEMLVIKADQMKKQILKLREKQIDSKQISNRLENATNFKFQGSDKSNSGQNLELFQSMPTYESLSNINDLQRILDQMKKKLSDYEKELTHRQTLSNHQNYLIQKLKTQQNHLNQNQASLLQELQYTLKKAKKFKQQNDDLKAENEERYRQVRLLEEINAKLENDMSDLFMQINDLEKDKMDLQEKVRELEDTINCNLTVGKGKQLNGDITIASEQLASKTQIMISNDNAELLSPLDIDEKLEMEKRQNHQKSSISHNLSIFQIFNIKVYPQFDKKDENSLENNIFSQSIEIDDSFYFNQLETSRLKILQLQQQLILAKESEQQAIESIQKVKVVLKNLLKDLYLLQAEHQSAKYMYRQEKAHLEAQLKEKENLLKIAFSQLEKLQRKSITQNSIQILIDQEVLSQKISQNESDIN